MSSSLKRIGSICQMRSHETADVSFRSRNAHWRLRAALNILPKRGGVEMTLIERDAAIFDHAGDDSGPRGAGTDRAYAAMFFGNAVDLGTHFGRGEEGIFAAVHRCAAGMRGLPAEGDRVSLDAESSENGAERQIEIEQHRALFDVQFQIGGGVFQFLPAGLHVFEIDRVLL